MLADFTVVNNSPWDIKDIVLEARAYGASGTALDHNTRTFYEIVPAHTARPVTDFNLGFISDQAATAGAEITGFDFCGNHITAVQLAAIGAAQKQIAAAQVATNKIRATAAYAKALAANQAAAEKGDAYGLLRMGERYRDGEGVAKDLVKARDYLQRAAQAGSPTAAEELKKLP